MSPGLPLPVSTSLRELGNPPGFSDLAVGGEDGGTTGEAAGVVEGGREERGGMGLPLVECAPLRKCPPPFLKNLNMGEGGEEGRLGVWWEVSGRQKGDKGC